MTRIALGGIVHETNTFAPDHTTLADFRRQSYVTGDALVTRMRDTPTPIGGALQGIERAGYTPVPLLYTAAMPSGLVTRETYETLRDRLSAALQAALPVDGVLLTLHGAMVADGQMDCEGEILARVRAFVGRDCPIVTTLDMHGKISPTMVANADALVAFDTNPHLDTFERGLEAAAIMRRLVDDGLRTTHALTRPPLLLSALTTWTARAPLAPVHELARECERDPHVVNVSVMGGFAYADTPFTGVCMVVTTDGDAALAEHWAQRLHAVAWAHRDAAAHYGETVDVAVRRAVGAAPSTSSSTPLSLRSESAQDASPRRGPIILADVGDNVGGGSPGDSTVLLRALLAADARAAVVTIADAESVARAIAAGIGATVALNVGGKCDALHGEPVAMRAVVEHISAGRFTSEGNDHFAQLYGRNVEMGRCAVVRCDGVRVLLTERRTPPGDLAQLRSQGIVPEAQRVIVVKSAVAFRGAYERIASNIIEVDTPGLCAANVSRFAYKHLPRPIFPLDEEVNR